MFMFRFSKSNRSRKGFTIVEIVIVVAVIAVLAAILIPAGLYAQQGAEAEQLKTQINEAYTAYANALIADGDRADPIDSYIFFKPESINISGGKASSVKSSATSYTWDGIKDNDAQKQTYSKVTGDVLEPVKYGELYIVHRVARR